MSDAPEKPEMAEVSITRSVGGAVGERIVIELRVGRERISVSLTLEDFALAVTGRGGIVGAVKRRTYKLGDQVAAGTLRVMAERDWWRISRAHCRQARKLVDETLASCLEARQQRDEAERQRDEAVRQRDEAERQRDEAVRQRDEAVRQRDEAVRQRDEAQYALRACRKLLDTARKLADTTRRGGTQAVRERDEARRIVTSLADRVAAQSALLAKRAEAQVQQTEGQRAADPVARFPEMLATLISSGRAHIAGADGTEPGIPPGPEAWGWVVSVPFGPADEVGTNYRGRGRKIGWAVGAELYLDPDATYAALSELARDQGGVYPLTQQTLFRSLKESGRLLRTEKGRSVYPATLEGSRRRVLVLSTHCWSGRARVLILSTHCWGGRG